MEFIGIWTYFWFYFPLGVIGLWRWATWLFKKICALRYKPILTGSNKTLSIITPVYNEDPVVFKRALNSWQVNNPDEIIAVIDESDRACIESFEDFARDKSRMKLIITPKPGKRPALADGIKEARSEIVALVDSDTVWAPNIKEKMLAPFCDPKIGGVVPRQNSLETVSIWQKMTDIFWDLRNADEWSSLTTMGRALTCLSGRTALYRREILLSILDEFLNEILLGKRKESGDDKCFTRLIQRDGWNTYYQSNAQVFPTTTSDFRTFVRERVRWTRNSYNSDITSLSQYWIWKHPYLAFYTIDRFISSFTLLIAPIALCIALYLQQWIIVLILLGWWILSRGVKIIPHLKRRPKDILVLPVYVGVSFLIAIVKIYALVTIRKQKWIRGTGREPKKGVFEKVKDFTIPVFLTGGIICILVTLVIFVL